ncbi:MAG: hypothetical protein KDA83_20440 [Planctomycetales bacterium]|nr:hypothetical protein [Planctomycetales bacterium]
MDIVVVRELKSGEVRIFGYITGRIRFDTQPILEHLEAVLGPLSEHGSESMEDIKAALESFDGIDYVSKINAEQARPLIQVDYRTCSAVLDRALELGSYLEKVSEDAETISTKEDRYIYLSDGEVRDLGSWNLPVGGDRSLNKYLDSLVVDRFAMPAQGATVKVISAIRHFADLIGRYRTTDRVFGRRNPGAKEKDVT